MKKTIISSNILVIIYKIVCSRIIRRINIDNIYPALMRLFKQIQAVQIVAFKQEIIITVSNGDQLLFGILGEYGDMCLHLYINGFFMAFPYKPVFLGVQLIFNLSDSRERTVIIFMLLAELCQKFKHTLPLFL